MNTPQEPWNLHGEQPEWNKCGEAIGTPTYSSTSDSDGSSETDGDLLSLFTQPEDNHSRTREYFDRGGRPFPYTRSKTRWRKRPNDEIKYLRGQLVELEKLKASLSNPDTNLFQQNVDNHTETLRRLHEEDENLELKATLVENRKLRAMVAGRCQVAKALQVAIDDDVRLRARKVYCSDDAAVPNELIFV